MMKTLKWIVVLLFLHLTFVGLASDPVDVSFEREGLLLRGKFYRGEGSGPFSTVLLLPGFPGGPNDVIGMCRLLSGYGYNAMMFNYSGTFESEGETSFQNSQKDIAAALDFLNQGETMERFHMDPGKVYLGGWCYGGGMAVAYAVKHPEIKAVFTIAANDHGVFFREYERNPEMKQLVDKMFEDLLVAGSPVRFAPGALPRDFVKSGIENLDPAFDFQQCAPLLAPKDVLIIGAWDDEQTPFDAIAFPFYKALRREGAKHVKLVGIQDDHYFRNTRGEVLDALLSWLNTRPGF